LHRVRIVIDPEIEDRYAPEVHWAWRLLLAGIGYGWEQVSLGEPCHIAYVMDPRSTPGARLYIYANPELWSNRFGQTLAAVRRDRGLPSLVFGPQREDLAVVVAEEGRVVCRHDVVFDVFWLVTGLEEAHLPRTRHGFLDLTGTVTLSEELPRQALASEIGRWMQDVLANSGCPPSVPRWPGGKRAAMAAAHDVDYPEVVRWLEPLRVMRRQGSEGLHPAVDVALGRRHHWHFASWVALEQALGMRSAFYFCPRQGSLVQYALGRPDPFYDVTSPRFGELFRYLADSGCEVGLHASYAAYRSADRLARERRRLEEACGHAVCGNQHHYWHLDPDDPDGTLLLHEQVGLLYDTSLFHDRYVGWRRGISQPFFPFHAEERRELRTLQIPPVWMDSQLFGHNGHVTPHRWETLQGLVDRVITQEGCLLVVVHEYVYDNALYPDWAHTYQRLLELLAGRGDVWFATPAEIARHWVRRYASLVDGSLGLEAGMV